MFKNKIGVLHAEHEETLHAKHGGGTRSIAIGHGGVLPSEEAKALGDLESSTFQSKKLVREAFISTNKTQLSEKKTKQEYLKNKKSISKRSSSYPLKEKNFHTTLLLDQTITAYDKTPLAITAIMSREEGEIENLKNNSASLILKNSDIEILSD